MSSLSYEVALFGQFFAVDLTGASSCSCLAWRTSSHLTSNCIGWGMRMEAIMNRITLHTESAHQILTREFVFEPVDGLQQREDGAEPVALRARKEVLEPHAKWCVLHSISIYSVVELFGAAVQDALLVLEARVCARAPRGDGQAVGDVPGRGRCAELRVCAGVHVRLFSDCRFGAMADVRAISAADGGSSSIGEGIRSGAEGW